MCSCMPHICVRFSPGQAWTVSCVGVVFVHVVSFGDMCVCVRMPTALVVCSRLCLDSPRCGHLSQQAVMVKVVARNVAAAKTMNLHPYALKVPSCKRSGNSAIDEENDSKVQLLKELIDACLKDLNHVGPLFGKLRERQSTAIVSEETPFRGVTQLRNLDEDFVISF